MADGLSNQARKVREGVDALLKIYHDSLRGLVAHYLDDRSTPRFSGRLFDRYGDNPPKAFVGDDLIACATLDVPINGTGVDALLVIRRATYARLLADIDPEATIWSPDPSTRAAMEAAGRLREALRDDIPGIGWTRAHKLVARKRPRLHPVYDTVVKAWFSGVDGIRYGLHELILAEDAAGNAGDLKRRLDDALRPDGVELDTLRLLDIAVWMCGSQSGPAATVRRNLNVDVPADRARS